jgi:hypothetical protein
MEIGSGTKNRAMGTLGVSKVSAGEERHIARRILIGASNAGPSCDA